MLGGMEKSPPISNPASKDTKRPTQEVQKRPEAQTPTLESVRHFFEEQGIFSVTTNPNTGEEIKVIDDMRIPKVLHDLTAASRKTRSRWNKEGLFAVLPEVIGNTPVVTRQQISKGDFEARPFFYIPESPDAATNTLAIKKARFHHLIADFVEPSQEKAAVQPTKYPGKEGVSEFESRVAVLLFHPEYGDGFRSEQGELFVRDRETGEYKKFSGDFLRSHGVDRDSFLYPKGKRVITGKTRFAPRSVREGVAIELPHLVSKNLVQPVRDFKQITFRTDGGVERRVERVGVSPSGARNLRGVLHYIGREFYGKPVRIVEISPALGAVVDISGGAEKVTHLFNIVSRGQATPAKSGMYLANAPHTQTRPFSAEQVALPRRTDESLEQYHDRTEKTDRGLAFLILHVFPKHPELAEMLRETPAYELASIAQAAYLLERDKQMGRFDSLVEQYGGAGAQTFLVTADNEILREQVFDFAESVPQEDVKAVFAAYGTLVSTIDDLSAYLRNTFGSESRESADALTQKVLERAKALLASAHEYKNEPQKLLKLVEAMQVEQVLFYEAFRELRKRGEILDFSHIAGLEFRSVESAGEPFSQADKDAMVQVTAANYAAKSPEFRAAVVRGLTEAFGNPTSKFYVLRYNGKIVGFNRFDEMGPMPDGTPRKYFGSFNVDPAFGNGKLGDVMIEQTVLHEAQSAVIEAHCLPDAPITQRYLKDGFVVIGEDKEMYPEPVLHIRLDRLSQPPAQTQA